MLGERLVGASTFDPGRDVVRCYRDRLVELRQPLIHRTESKIGMPQQKMRGLKVRIELYRLLETVDRTRRVSELQTGPTTP